MAHGICAGANKRFFWNVDSHVGPGCPNKPEDVQLVQYGYFSMARNPNRPTTFTPAELATIKAVVPGAPYSGGPSDPLTLAIKAHQRIRGGTQDGKVSPVSNSTGSYGPVAWMIIALSNNILDVLPDVYPLLHKGQNCPPALGAASRRTFSATA